MLVATPIFSFTRIWSIAIRLGTPASTTGVGHVGPVGALSRRWIAAKSRSEAFVIVALKSPATMRGALSSAARCRDSVESSCRCWPSGKSRDKWTPTMVTERCADIGSVIAVAESTLRFSASPRAQDCDCIGRSRDKIWVEQRIAALHATRYGKSAESNALIDAADPCASTRTITSGCARRSHCAALCGATLSFQALNATMRRCGIASPGTQARASGTAPSILAAARQTMVIATPRQRRFKARCNRTRISRAITPSAIQ